MVAGYHRLRKPSYDENFFLRVNFHHPNRPNPLSGSVLQDSYDDVIAVGDVNLQAEKTIRSDGSVGLFPNEKSHGSVEGFHPGIPSPCNTTLLGE